MDITKFNEMFRDPELRDVLWPKRETAKEIEQEDLVANLFSVKDEHKAKFITLFVESIEYDREHGIHKGTCGKLTKKFDKSIKKLEGPVKKTLEKVVAAAKATKTAKSPEFVSISPPQSADKEVKSKEPKVEALASASIGEFGKFPEQLLPLSAFAKRGQELRLDNDSAKALMFRIRDQVALDPEITSLTTDVSKRPEHREIVSSMNPPFDFNRTAREIEGAFCNASDVRMGKRRNYLLSPCPHDPKEAGTLYDAAIGQGIRVFVSLAESTECLSRCNNFWTPEKLAEIPLRDGWKIEATAKRVLAESAKEPHGTHTPQIIQTSLTGKKTGREDHEIAHLHHEAWRDQAAAPSDELILTLLEEIDRLQGESDAPIEINCKGGVGRTGTIAVLHFLIHYINEQLANGVPLDEIKINVPEVIYAFRKQRSGIVSKEGPQLAQIYAVLGLYYTRLKAKQEQATKVSGSVSGIAVDGDSASEPTESRFSFALGLDAAQLD